MTYLVYVEYNNIFPHEDNKYNKKKIEIPILQDLDDIIIHFDNAWKEHLDNETVYSYKFTIIQLEADIAAVVHIDHEAKLHKKPRIVNS